MPSNSNRHRQTMQSQLPQVPSCYETDQPTKTAVFIESSCKLVVFRHGLEFVKSGDLPIGRIPTTIASVTLEVPSASTRSFLFAPRTALPMHLTRHDERILVDEFQVIKGQIRVDTMIDPCGRVIQLASRNGRDSRFAGSIILQHVCYSLHGS